MDFSTVGVGMGVMRGPNVTYRELRNACRMSALLRTGRVACRIKEIPVISPLKIYTHNTGFYSSGQNRWLLCPLVPEGIIQFSVTPAGKNIPLIKDQCSNFHDIFF